MYILTDEPKSSSEAWTALDNAFGTEEFSREGAASVLTQAGIEDVYGTLDKLVNAGYVSETQ